MSEKSSRLYFAYGSNMDSGQMGFRCPGSELIGTAKLAGYRFRINTRGVATVVPDENGEVLGLLWRISDSDEVSLDRYEGVGNGLYGKEMLEVEVSPGSPEEALVYIASDAGPGTSRSLYMEGIVAAAEEHGLPGEYVAGLRSWLDGSGY